MGGVFIENNKNYAIFPLEMIYDDKYKDLQVNDFFLYMLLLNRTNISKKNLKFFSDKKGIFVYYSNEQITKDVRCSHATATKSLKKLEQAGLIRKEYQKRGLPLKIYVNDIRDENENTYSAHKQPQDKFSYKSRSYSDYKEKHFTSQNMKKEKDVSFDVEMAEKIAKDGTIDFGTMKIKKRRTRSSGPTL